MIFGARPHKPGPGTLQASPARRCPSCLLSASTAEARAGLVEPPLGASCAKAIWHCCRCRMIFCSSCLGVCLVSRVLAFKARRWHIPFQWDALLDYSGYSYVCYGAITSGVDLRWHCCPTTTMFAEQIVPSCTATDAQQQLCLLSRLRLVAATTMFAEQAWPFGAWIRSACELRLWEKHKKSYWPWHVLFVPNLYYM